MNSIIHLHDHVYFPSFPEEHSAHCEMEDISGSGITGHLHFVQMVSTLYFTIYFTKSQNIVLLSNTGPDPLENHKDIFRVGNKGDIYTLYK